MVERSGRYLVEFKDIPSERQKMPELPVEERASNFNEVELVFSQEQAVAEANRCLSCRRCIGCALCLAVCQYRGIDFLQADKDIELEAGSVIMAPGVERISSPVEEKFGYGKYANVVTFSEFERILSDSGPYAGLVLRPYDGEIPAKIAFIPVSSQEGNYALLSAGKAALAAHRKIAGLETRLFFSGAEAYQNELSRNIEKESRVTVAGGEVLSVAENEETRDLVLEYSENGKTKKEDFGLVVLLTTYELPNDIKAVAEGLGLGLASYRFQDTADTSLLRTAKEGVFFTGLAFNGASGKAV